MFFLRFILFVLGLARRRRFRGRLVLALLHLGLAHVLSLLAFRHRYRVVNLHVAAKSSGRRIRKRERGQRDRIVPGGVGQRVDSTRVAQLLVLVENAHDGLIIVGLARRAQQVDPHEPDAVDRAATLAEKVSTVERQVIADPHDFLLKVLGVDDKVRRVLVAVGVEKVTGLVSVGHVIDHAVKGDFRVAGDVDAADESELAFGFVFLQLVLVQLASAAGVGMFTRQRHQRDDFLRENRANFAQRLFARRANVLAPTYAILAN